uniref:Uncharacterized protein n=1 Tax=Rhizophora mucronata TaxID=61149 RepID=A0A2P2R216_RHIMU
MKRKMDGKNRSRPHLRSSGGSCQEIVRQLARLADFKADE